MDFVSGRFAPLRTELTEHHLRVQGTIPDWLDGRYVRNGPNPIADVSPDDYNWFTGDGMVHGVRLCDGNALWYRNRWVDSEATARLLGRPSPSEARRSPLHGPSANTNVIGFAGRTLALVEGGIACAELSEELETIDICDFNGTVRGGYTGHPILDPRTGELHAVSYHFGRGNTVQYTVVGADGSLRFKRAVTVGGSPMMHAFSLTRDYVVIYDLPVTFDAREAAEMSVGRPLRPLVELALGTVAGRVRLPPKVMSRMPPFRAGQFPYRWNAEYRPRVGLLPRGAEFQEPVWIDLPEPCYVFHPLNAWNNGEQVVAEVVVHERVFDADAKGPSEGRPRLERWCLDAGKTTVSREQLVEHHVEFPRIDERFTTASHSMGWAISGTDDFAGEHRVVRITVGTGDVLTRDFGTRSTVSEFVFVPRSDGAAEGDGVLMGFVTNLADNTSDLRILDATTLADIAAVSIPQRVPAGFHGNWIGSHRQS